MDQNKTMKERLLDQSNKLDIPTITYVTPRAIIFYVAAITMEQLKSTEEQNGDALAATETICQCWKSAIAAVRKNKDIAILSRESRLLHMRWPALFLRRGDRKGRPYARIS